MRERSDGCVRDHQRHIGAVDRHRETARSEEHTHTHTDRDRETGRNTREAENVS